MIGREDLDECPKCYNTGIHIQHHHRTDVDAHISTAQWCDCPIAKRYLTALRQRFIGLKSRLSLVERDFLERMAQLQKPQ